MKPTASLSLTTSVAASLGASLCCTAPLLLVMAGLGGSWMATLRAFEPLRPLFVLAAIGALALAYRQIFRAPVACGPDEACDIPAVQRRRKLLFWIVAAAVAGLLASPHLIPYLVA